MQDARDLASMGKRLTEVRKDKKMSQDDVGKLVGVHGAVIGRYERDEVKPSIEMATQLAEALEVSLDYLVGSTDILLENSIVNKILDIQKLKENDKQHVFALLDAPDFDTFSVLIF
jgi:transcriptional regulator with XRE-family HTH domain